MTGAPTVTGQMNKKQLILACGMLVTGSINTIANKVADWQRAEGVNKNCPDWSSDFSSGVDDAPSSPPPPPPEPCKFVHPFFQALIMFMGEASCLVAYFGGRSLERWRGNEVPAAEPFNKFIFLLPACCDSEHAPTSGTHEPYPATLPCSTKTNA